MKNPNPDPAARNAIPAWNQDEKFYEDYEAGEVDRSIRRTISEGEDPRRRVVIVPDGD